LSVAKQVVRDVVVLATLMLIVVAVVIWRGSDGGTASDTSGTPGSGCYACHGSDEGPTGAHARVPCQSCHLGDTTGTNVLSAHVGLEREPGALDTADRACAPCHVTEFDHVRGSLMATGRGLIAVDRWALGETPSPDGDETFTQVLAGDHPTPAQGHLRRLCTGCHLGTRRDNRDDAIVGEASGCSACHAAPQPAGEHVRLSAVVDSQRCFGCHSRSARISLSYQGLVEVAGPAAQACATPRLLEDGRTLCTAPADVHFEAGLGCTDCHLHTELMGDGQTYPHEQQAVEVRCASCHGGDATRETTWAQVDDDISQRILSARSETRPAQERVRTGVRGTPLWNLRPSSDGGWELRRKSSVLPPIRVQQMRAESHALPGHERLECVACHARSAPRCPTCHTTFEPGEEQWDFGTGRAMPGLFREQSDGVGSGVPALGVRNDDRILPAIPGMVAQLELGAAGGETRSLRLYSLLDPHTTGTRARSCDDCHRQSWSLGLGEGVLEAERDTLRYIPARASAEDPNMDAHAWTRVDAEVPGSSTRTGARSLNRDELARALRVGACLRCHSATDAIYRDFAAARARRQAGEAPRCQLPVER